MTALLYTFYGDDFTGSTDVLEQLAAGGVNAVLFFGVPTASECAAMPGIQAVGVAGDSRSRSPQWMTAELPRVFRGLRLLGAPVTHYKVCSTFDSSPGVGNIGRAMELGADVFASRVVPVVVGAPHLRRYVRDGELFAADAAGLVRRIDQHPMSRHPVTPMREARLSRHLAKQTAMRIVDGTAAWDESQVVDEVFGAVFDTDGADDGRRIGLKLWSEAKAGQMFAVGSSGLTAALLSAWRAEGLVQDGPGANRRTGQSRMPLLVVSGSCSEVTERQLRWALANGFAGVPLEPQELRNENLNGVASKVEANLRTGRDTVVYTALGAPPGLAGGEELGIALGNLLRSVLRESGVRRVLLCGGDTSSHAVQQLGLRALTWKSNLQPGVPLCTAHARGLLDGLEMALKGGQMGSDDFFAVVRDARA